MLSFEPLTFRFKVQAMTCAMQTDYYYYYWCSVTIIIIIIISNKICYYINV